MYRRSKEAAAISIYDVDNEAFILNAKWIWGLDLLAFWIVIASAYCEVLYYFTSWSFANVLLDALAVILLSSLSHYRHCDVPNAYSYNAYLYRKLAV